MKLKIFLTAIMFPFVGAIFNGCSSVLPMETKTIVLNTNSGAYSYLVEVADIKEEREHGLKERESLDEDKGMLFIFEEERKVAFWMMNTLIYLDMIFVDKDLKVIDYFENTIPCESEPCPRYIPNNEVMYVLELNAGQIIKIGLVRGDLMEIK